jgi:hypothetical protein
MTPTERSLLRALSLLALTPDSISRRDDVRSRVHLLDQQSAQEANRHRGPTFNTSGRFPTEEEIEAARTPAGSWTRAQLAEWGVPWPPRKGWKAALILGSSTAHALSEGEDDE